MCKNSDVTRMKRGDANGDGRTIDTPVLTRAAFSRIIPESRPAPITLTTGYASCA